MNLASHTSTSMNQQNTPSSTPYIDLMTKRAKEVPVYTGLQFPVPTDTDYAVLNIPFGKRSSKECRQWAKNVGAYWNLTSKEWRIGAYRLKVKDTVRVINDLRLYRKCVAKVAEFCMRTAPANTGIVLKIPYEEALTAKAIGARWNPAGRFWSLPVKFNDTAFSTLISTYEANGWVDVQKTISFFSAAVCDANPNHKFGFDALKVKHTPINTSGAAAMPFVLFDPVAMGSVSGFVESPITQPEKDFLACILQRHCDGEATIGTDCIEELTLTHPTPNFGRGTNESWCFYRLGGTDIIRVARFTCSNTHAEYTPAAVNFASAETTRHLWQHFVESGFVVKGSVTFSLADSLYVLTGSKGIYNNANRTISGAVDLLRRRVDSQIDDPSMRRLK